MTCGGVQGQCGGCAGLRAGMSLRSAEKCMTPACVAEERRQVRALSTPCSEDTTNDNNADLQ